MSDQSYEEEEQVDDMETKMSFLDSFLSEDNSSQDCKDNKQQSTTTLITQTTNNTLLNESNSNVISENSDYLDKYIENECKLNINNKKKRKAKTLKEFLNKKDCKYKCNKYELIENKYSLSTEIVLSLITLMFLLMILYVLKLLMFALIMFLCGCLMWIIYVNKTILLKNKKDLLEWFKGEKRTKGSNMKELSYIRKEESENIEVDPEITQSLIYI